MRDIIIVVILLVGLFFVFKFLKKFKMLPVGALVFFTGGLKAGKSTLSVYTAVRKYKSNLFKVKFVNFFRRLFGKQQDELPLLYSNVPLNVPYVALTQDLLTMKKRFARRSVCYIQEASLFADSQLIKDKDLNNKLLLFFKLFSHITHGGSCILDSQNCLDIHYSCKRSLSNYIYVHHTNTKFPFFVVAYVRELIYSEDASISNVFNSDIEDDLRKIIIPKSVWKKFDRFCMSLLTDGKPLENKVIRPVPDDDLKVRKIVSFRPEFNILIDEQKKTELNNLKEKLGVNSYVNEKNKK